MAPFGLLVVDEAHRTSGDLGDAPTALPDLAVDTLPMGAYMFDGIVTVASIRPWLARVIRRTGQEVPASLSSTLACAPTGPHHRGRYDPGRPTQLAKLGYQLAP